MCVEQLGILRMTKNKQYLGDGIYVSYDGFIITLTTENGIDVTNEIFLEKINIRNLLEFLVRNDITKNLIILNHD